MPDLPDQFDLWVRRARDVAPERQADFLLGSLFALKEWFFLNRGSDEKPSPGVVELEGRYCLVVFSDLGKMHDFVGSATSNLAIPTESVVGYCREFRAMGVTALLVNPGDYAFTVELDAVESFDKAWRERRAAHPSARGFWIPNLTTEEEDFWQSHGL